MSKRLPYFQFEPAEYLAGDIFFCSYGAQGMFNNICALYWQKDCELKHSQVVKRFKNEELIQELITENIIKVAKDKITINFLDEQFSKATVKHVVNSENGKKGATKRWQKNSEAIAKPSKTNSELDGEIIALREDKIREDEIKENKTIVIIDNTFFSNECKVSDQWLETVAIEHKIKTDLVKIYLDTFENHLIGIEEQKTSTKEFKYHFKSWMKKQNFSAFIERKSGDKPFGTTNQI